MVHPSGPLGAHMMRLGVPIGESLVAGLCGPMVTRVRGTRAWGGYQPRAQVGCETSWAYQTTPTDTSLAPGGLDRPISPTKDYAHSV